MAVCAPTEIMESLHAPIRVFLIFFTRLLITILGIGFISCSAVLYEQTSLDLTEYPQNTLPCKDSIIVMQWNIGHFSKGIVPSSQITDIDFENKVKEFKVLIDNSSADVISLCEYSLLFANTDFHPECYADTLLFSEYQNQFIGNNGVLRHFSLNAIMSKRELVEPSSVDYVVNHTATITHTSAIKATDYYYNRCYINVGDRNVVLVNTHLAFDKNNPEIAVNQIKELIAAFKDDEYVLICGDFNTSASSYKLFIDAGYQLANSGDLETFPSTKKVSPLDNIVSKGLAISNVAVIISPLSDHYPIICKISVFD